VVRAIGVERRIALKAKSKCGTIISVDEEQLSLLRNLQFKHFLISVIAKSLKTIIGKKVDSRWRSRLRRRKQALTVCLILWPGGHRLSKAFSLLVAAKVSPSTLAVGISEEGFIDNVARDVSALLYAGKASVQHADFAGLISSS
jgi:hypothetical protein